LRSLKFGILIFLIAFSTSFPSVWGQKVGRYFLSASETFYTAENLFDSRGVRYYLPEAGIYNKYETNVYFEYGLDTDIMMIANVSFLGLSYRDNLGFKTNGGFGNQEIGLQYTLHRGIPTTALQFLLSFPFYSNAGDPPLGNSQVDLQAGVLIGAPFSSKGFWELFFGIRKRFEAPADQLRGSFTVGFELSKRIRLITTASLILGLGNQDSVSVGSIAANVNQSLDFSLLKVEPALVYKFNKNYSGYLGFAFDAWGRQVGAGYAFKVGVWYEP
jgi:hypothetical protein